MFQSVSARGQISFKQLRKRQTLAMTTLNLLQFHIVMQSWPAKYGGVAVHVNIIASIGHHISMDNTLSFQIEIELHYSHS